MKRTPLVLFVLLLAVTAVLGSQDTYCPTYPASDRAFDQQAIIADLRYAAFPSTRKHAATPAVKNVIDEGIFKKMAADGVDAAPLTNDAEFVRRIYLDLTGRIPTYEQAEAFINDQAPRKRESLIDSLLGSPAYVDQISHWFLERFQVRAGQRWISVPAAVNFYTFIRDFVRQDRPYNRVVQEILTARGDSDVEPGMALLIRQVEDFNGNPRQDSWDDITNIATTEFLGIRTECISCHSGRGHLEKINVFLTNHTRREFWKLSAFFSRTRMQVVSDDNASFRPRLIVTDVTAGLYNGAIDPARPGARPSRSSANEEPLYWFTGQTAEGPWRDEFARILTADRQFARAAVNYLWAYFFGAGIVDPPDGWDLSRVDPSIPPPEGWASQNTHPEVLEALADHFIRSNYSIRSVIKLIVNSNTYQLSSRYPTEKWQDAFKRYFARYEPRRLSAEQLFDSLTTATGTDSQMAVVGVSDVIRYGNQLPYPGSSTDFTSENLMNSLGRGDFMTRRSLNKPSLFGILDFMNNWAAAVRTRSQANRYTPQSRLSQWMAEGLTDDELVRRMFMSTLTRPPTATELHTAQTRTLTDNNQWFSALQWALIQKSDFVFKY